MTDELACARCRIPLEYAGTRDFHHGTRWGALATSESFVNKEHFDVYVCPRAVCRLLRRRNGRSCLRQRSDPELMREAASRWGTPLYVTDLDAAADRAAAWRAALPGALVAYAVKANPDPALLRRLAA